MGGFIVGFWVGVGRVLGVFRVLAFVLVCFQNFLLVLVGGLGWGVFWFFPSSGLREGCWGTLV